MIISSSLKNGTSVDRSLCTSTYRNYSTSTYRKYGKTPCLLHEFKKLRESDKERFYSLLLDAKNKVIAVDFVSQGTLDSAAVHPREVYKPAIISSASSVIFVHAHPSGDPKPSESDREITKTLKNAGEIMGIRVLDHIIIGAGAYDSFADTGKLDEM